MVLVKCYLSFKMPIIPATFCWVLAAIAEYIPEEKPVASPGVLTVADHREFLSYFLREQRRLMAYLLSATGDVHAAEDLLQSIARILLEKLGEYDEARPFGAWATGVAKLEVCKWRQQASRSREVISEKSMQLLSETAAEDEDAAEADDRYSFLAECLGALGGTGRRVVQMKYGDGCRIAEIAALVGKSVVAIEMMLVRVRRDLRDCVERKMSHTNVEVA